MSKLGEAVALNIIRFIVFALLIPMILIGGFITLISPETYRKEKPTTKG